MLSSPRVVIYTSDTGLCGCCHTVLRTTVTIPIRVPGTSPHEGTNHNRQPPTTNLLLLLLPCHVDPVCMLLGSLVEYMPDIHVHTVYYSILNQCGLYHATSPILTRSSHQRTMGVFLFSRYTPRQHIVGITIDYPSATPRSASPHGPYLTESKGTVMHRRRLARPYLRFLRVIRVMHPALISSFNLRLIP